MTRETPVLWQIKISHYNEKARWALDYKRVPHRRRAPLPLFGTLPIAWALTGGTTLPVLQLDGRAIGDSTQIIAALEERYPDPALYPSDPADRGRALALEHYFDEQAAPHVRRLVWYETMKQADTFVAVAVPDAGPFSRVGLRATAPLAIGVVKRRYGITDDTAAQARGRVVAGMQRLEAEIGSAGYLAGDGFSVADLTAASLFTPLLAPPQRPHLPDVEFPAPLQDFYDELAQMEGSDWILDIYRRYRRGSADIGADLTAASAR